MLCGAPLWRILGLNAIIWTALPGAVTKECLKRDVLGHRENNVYTCDHPAYTECCEHRGRFTCCEALVDKNLREQLQLWGVIVAIVVLAAMIYTCVARDGPVFESDTLKQAVKKKLGMRSYDARGGSVRALTYEPEGADSKAVRRSHTSPQLTQL